MRGPTESRDLHGADIPATFYATLNSGFIRQEIAYAAVRELIAKHCRSLRKALDYGCGTGRSTCKLKESGFENVVGVDVKQGMLDEAKALDMPGISYRLIQSGDLQFNDEEFDLAFSGIVFPEIPDKDEIPKILQALKRVTVNQGIIMILTCTKAGYVTDSEKFTCLLSDAEKDRLQDGNLVPTAIVGSDTSFNDYYWSDPFLRNAFAYAGLTVIETRLPVATPEQRKASPYLTDEACYVIYVCKKMALGE